MMVSPLSRRRGNGTARIRRLEMSWIAFLAMGVFAGVVLAAPTVVVVLNSFNAANYMSFPPQAFSLRWYEAILDNGALLRSIRTSALIATAVTIADLVIGVPAALALVRGNFRGREAIMAFTLSPLMVPQLVIGYALLVYFVQLNVSLGITTLILGHIVVSAPFIIRVVGGGVARLDPTLEEAAANLGAAPWAVFRRVTLPALAPSIVAGAAFAFLASFDNLEISLFLASGRIQTLPVNLFSLLMFDVDPIVGAIATLQILFAVLLLFVMERLLGLGQLGAASTR